MTVTNTLLTVDQVRIEAQMRAARALPDVIAAFPADFDAFEWNVNSRIEACVSVRSGTRGDCHVRAGMRELAARLGMAYNEQKRRGYTSLKLVVSGTVDGVPVELWQLAEPCVCGCTPAVAA